MDEHFEYRTGRTDPAKSSRGLIAILLICVIFLGGLVSVLSIMNIHLFFWNLSNTPAAPLSFAEGAATASAEDCFMLAGMALQETDPVYQQLHELPEGLFVAQVEAGSLAEKLRIQPGDVLIALDKMRVSTLEAVQEFLGKEKGCQLLLWRDGREISLTISD